MLQVQGVPHLSNDAFKTYMNIVALEGKIAGMEKCKSLNQANPGHIEFEVNNVKRQMDSITHKKTPEELLNSLYKHDSF